MTKYRTQLHAQYLGGSTGNSDYVFGVQPGQRSRFWLSRVQGVKVLALVVAAPAVDLTVLSQSQAVGGACSHVNHLLPWEERATQIHTMTSVAIQTFTPGQSGLKDDSPAVG